MRDSNVEMITISHFLKVEEKVTKMQRNYMLQEQLKIIKKELGIEVRTDISLLPYLFCATIER